MLWLFYFEINKFENIMSRFELKLSGQRYFLLKTDGRRAHDELVLIK